MPDEFGKETPLERYERLAEAFYNDTGLMAPGKDCPPELAASQPIEERKEKWDLWMAAQALVAPKPVGDLEIRNHLNSLITGIMSLELDWKLRCSQSRDKYSFANSFTSPTIRAVDEHLKQFLDVLRAAADQLSPPGTPDGRNPRTGFPNWTGNNR